MLEPLVELGLPMTDSIWIDSTTEGGHRCVSACKLDPLSGVIGV